MNKTNEPCAAAALIRAQGQQIEHETIVEYIRRKQRERELENGRDGKPIEIEVHK